MEQLEISFMPHVMICHSSGDVIWQPVKIDCYLADHCGEKWVQISWTTDEGQLIVQEVKDKDLKWR